MAKNTTLTEITLLILIALVVIFIIRGNAPETGLDYWPIPSTSCTIEDADNICQGFIFDCITHIDENMPYMWNGDIKCIAGQCACISE